MEGGLAEGEAAEMTAATCLPIESVLLSQGSDVAAR